MSMKNVRPALVSGDDDVVPRDGRGATSDTTHLAEHVWQPGQLRASGFMVRFAVVGDDHPARARDPDGCAEPTKVLGASVAKAARQFHGAE